MKEEHIHPIRYVALHTGLKPHLIRTWEDRYGVVHPKRTRGNRRLYCDSDVRRLRLLKSVVDSGHNISSVAPLPDEELARLLSREADARPPWEAPAGTPAGGPVPDGVDGGAGRVVEEALHHVVQLDAVSLERLMGGAAVAMPRQAFLQDVVMPLFKRIGEMWRDGKLKIVCEHMASIVVRSMLYDMLRVSAVGETAPGIVIATPVGHWHELGALASALAALESGWRVYYFGPNLPSEEIVYAVKKLEARVLALSLSHHLDDNVLAGEMAKIRRLAGAGLRIIVGGGGAAASIKAFLDIHAMVVNDLEEFRRKLEIFSSEESDG